MIDVSLTYLFDPLCGWCYGAAPAIGGLNAAKRRYRRVGADRPLRRRRRIRDERELCRPCLERRSADRPADGTAVSAKLIAATSWETAIRVSTLGLRP